MDELTLEQLVSGVASAVVRASEHLEAENERVEQAVGAPTRYTLEAVEFTIPFLAQNTREQRPPPPPLPRLGPVEFTGPEVGSLRKGASEGAVEALDELLERVASIRGSYDAATEGAEVEQIEIPPEVSVAPEVLDELFKGAHHTAREKLDQLLSEYDRRRDLVSEYVETQSAPPATAVLVSLDPDKLAAAGQELLQTVTLRLRGHPERTVEAAGQSITVTEGE